MRCLDYKEMSEGKSGDFCLFRAHFPSYYTQFHSTRVLTIERTVNKDYHEFDQMLQYLLPWPMNALITNQLNGSLTCQEDKQTYPIAQPSGCRLGPPDAWFSPDPFCGI